VRDERLTRLGRSNELLRLARQGETLFGKVRANTQHRTRATLALEAVTGDHRTRLTLDDDPD